MPLIDTEASTLIRELREQQGLSPEALAREIAKMASHRTGWTQGTVDAYTIRRIEGSSDGRRPGFVPGIRVRFILATYFDRRPDEIWKAGRGVRVPGSSRTRARARVSA